MAGEYTRSDTWTVVTSSVLLPAGAFVSSSEISNNNTLGQEIGVSIKYNAGTFTDGPRLFFLKEVDNDVFETITGSWGILLPYSSSLTVRTSYHVPPIVGSFKIYLSNDSGVGLTGSITRRVFTIA